MRDYDPVTGSYLQPDPLGLVDGPAVYAYAKGAPGVYIDPRGEQSDGGRRPIPAPMWPGESYPSELGGAMIGAIEGAISGANNLLRICVDAVTCAINGNCDVDDPYDNACYLYHEAPSPFYPLQKLCYYQCEPGGEIFVEYFWGFCPKIIDVPQVK